MDTITETTARAIANEMREACSGVANKYGVTIEFAGGYVREATKVMLKFSVCATTAKGEVSVSESRSEGLWNMFQRDGITVEGTVMGSIWDTPNGLCKIVNYHPTRRKYPFEIEYLDGSRRLTTLGFFHAGRQQTVPDAPAMYWWLKVDPDLLSDVEQLRFNLINNWLTMYVAAEYRERFYEAVNNLIERGVTTTKADKFRIAIMSESSWNEIIETINSL